MKYLLLNTTDTLNLLYAGAIIQDELAYFDTLDEDDVVGAPIYLNRAQIGVVQEEVLAYLAEHAENAISRFVKLPLLMPGLAYHNYWMAEENKDARLFHVRARYVDERLRGRSVIFSIAHEEESLVDEDGNKRLIDIETNPTDVLLYDALRIVYTDDPESDDGDDGEEIEGDVSTEGEDEDE